MHRHERMFFSLKKRKITYLFHTQFYSLIALSFFAVLKKLKQFLKENVTSKRNSSPLEVWT